MIERLSAGVVLTWDHRNCNTITGSEAEVVQHGPEESNFTPHHWISLSKLIQRPWFRRLWIRQEVQLASKVLVRCGYAEIDWGNIEKAIIFVEHKVSRAYISAEDILFCRSLFSYLGSDRYVYVPKQAILSNLILILYTIGGCSLAETFRSNDVNRTLALFTLEYFLG